MRHNPSKTNSIGRRHDAVRYAQAVAAVCLALSKVAVCLALSLVAAGAAFADEPTDGGNATAVTIILVRHAEAGDDDPRNPHLSADGEERATELGRVLGDLKITHLFASEYHRTQDTLAPLAERAGLEVVERSARQPEALVEELRDLPDGAVAIISGHSNTVPDLVQRLGGKPTGLEEHPKHGWLLPHDEYSRMFVVTLHRPAGQADAPGNFIGCLELRFGAP